MFKENYNRKIFEDAQKKENLAIDKVERLHDKNIKSRSEEYIDNLDGGHREDIVAVVKEIGYKLANLKDKLFPNEKARASNELRDASKEVRKLKNISHEEAIELNSQLEELQIKLKREEEYANNLQSPEKDAALDECKKIEEKLTLFKKEMLESVD